MCPGEMFGPGSTPTTPITPTMPHALVAQRSESSLRAELTAITWPLGPGVGLVGRHKTRGKQHCFER